MNRREASSVGVACAAAVLSGSPRDVQILLAGLSAADLRKVVREQAESFSVAVRLMAQRDGLPPAAALEVLRQALATFAVIEDGRDG